MGDAIHYKICPRCKTEAALDAAACVKCGRQYRTQFQVPEERTQMVSVLPPVPVSPRPIAPATPSTLTLEAIPPKPRRSLALWLIAAFVVLLLAITNPGKQQFSDWAKEQIKVNERDPLVRGVGFAIAGPLLESHTRRANFVVASLFTVQNDAGETTWKALGIAGFILPFVVPGPAPVATQPAPEPPQASPEPAPEPPAYRPPPDYRPEPEPRRAEPRTMPPPGWAPYPATPGPSARPELRLSPENRKRAFSL